VGYKHICQLPFQLPQFFLYGRSLKVRWRKMRRRSGVFLAADSLGFS